MNNNMTTILLVRHADIDIPTTVADDIAIPLNPRGEKRAQNLANILEKTSITAIYTSNAHRTIQTTEPLLKLLPNSIETKKIDEYEKIVEDILLSHKGETVLVIYHSPSIPKIIEKISGENNHTVTGFADLYIVNFHNPDNSKSKYANVIHLKYDNGI
jgi:broad specificity phosphatase PhoE